MSKTSTVNSGVTFFRSALGVIAGAMMLTASFDASAQVVYNEGFDQNPVPGFAGSSTAPYINTALFSTLWPNGWISGKYGTGTDNDNRWDRVKGSGAPTVAAARTGSGMARFLSDFIDQPEASFLSSRRLDFQGYAGGAATTNFWMWRDNTAGATGTDRIQVYLSNHPDPSLATVLVLMNETGSGLNAINRHTSLAPVIASGVAGWNNYSYNLATYMAGGSPPFPAGSRDSVYITIIGTAGGGVNALGATPTGNNIYIDDFQVTFWPKTQAYVTSSLSFQNTATTAAGATDQLIVGGYIRVDGEGTPSSAANITFNWNGTSNPGTDIQNAKLWYTGGSNSFTTNSNATQIGGTILNPSLSTNMTFSGTQQLTHGDNYFWITFDIKAGATSGNCVDAEFVSFDLQRTKTGSCPPGSAVVTVTDTVGLAAGMGIVGQASSITIATLTSLTTVTMNNTIAAGISAGPIVFYQSINVAACPTCNPPTTPTLAGCRLIDFLYCVANMSAGTSWAGYTRNDYISAVVLDGENTATNGIYTGRMWLPPGQVTACNSTPNFNLNPPGLGDCSGSSTLCGPYAGTGAWANSHCAFTTHPPDYELMPQVSGRTTSMIANGTTQYTLKVWAGTWYGANYTAAWLDLYAPRGTLSDSLLLTTYSGNPGTAASIVIPTVTSRPALNQIGFAWGGWGGAFAMNRPIWGPGIPSGTTIIGITGGTWAAPTGLILSQNVTTAIGDPIYVGQVGGEKIFQSNSLANGGAFMVSGAGLPYGTGGVVFTIPPNGATGLVRLRVREVYAVSNITSCGGWTWGETEDYIVTVIPPCDITQYGIDNTYDKVWLGFTDDWDNPLNWCPTGVPTLSDDVFIPDDVSRHLGGAATNIPRPGKSHPKIKANVVATTNRLCIADSITIDGYIGSNLQVNDSLIIRPSNATLTPAAKALRVISDYRKEVRVSNGNLANPFGTFSLFQDNNKTRALLTYDVADFSSQGIIAGDLIDTIRIPIRRGNAIWDTDYSNVIIRWSIIGPHNFLPGGFTALPAVYLSGPTNLFTGTVVKNNLAVTAYDTLVIPLPTPWVFPGAPFTGTNMMLIEVIADNNLDAGAGFHESLCTPTLTRNSYCVLYSSSSPLAPATLAPNAGQAGVAWVTGNRRPNLYFKSRRPYVKYPIISKKNWVNDGNFVAGNSIVQMSGIFNQRITGSSSTTFHELEINNPAHVTRKTDFTVTDTLWLTNGNLQLDSGTVHLTNPNIGGLTYTGGRLFSETAPASIFYGNFHWNMTGSTTSPIRVIPFRNAAGSDIFIDYTLVAGTHDMTFATYATPANNQPIPVHAAGPPGPVVANINGYATGTDNSMNMVDRYWKIYNATPAGATADLKIRWTAAEQTPGPGTYLGQRWVQNANSTTAGPGWEFPFLAQAPSANTASLTGFNLFADNIWWAVTKDISPLPVELLDFTAKPVGGQVRLNWSTASEINNDKFVVERTVNMNDWKFIDMVPSRGNSVVTQNYETWDENPVNGMQYYILRQYDIGGRLTNYGPLAVDLTKKAFGIVSASVQSSSQGITLIFNYDSNEPYSVEVIDMLGQVVGASSNNPANPGLNVMDIKANLSSGVYQVILRNSSQVDTRKIFY